MPINTDLNTAPYFDDFEVENQYYRVLFKPSFAVQSRELVQLQTILQNQVEQFADNIFKEGSIVKGCTFTELSDLKFVKLTDQAGFDVTQYVGGTQTEVIGAQEREVDVTYEITGELSNLRATIIASARGFESRDPNLNTFFINYLNTNEVDNDKVFRQGESLTINRVRFLEDEKLDPRPEDEGVATINVTGFANATGSSFGLKAAQGVIFQKGHFLFTNEQTVILSKYTNIPNDVSVGYRVNESIKTALQDPSLYDNANGSKNENAPGADRLELVPELVALPSLQAENDTTFFTLVKYENGSSVTIRDVSQYNLLGEEMARRTFEESGSYITEDFKTKVIRKNDKLQASIGAGAAYVNGYRIENGGERFIEIDPVSETVTKDNQPISFNYGNYVDITSITGTVSIRDYDTVTLRSSTTDIGTARVKNITQDRLFIFDVKITNQNFTFADTDTIVGTTGEITINSNTIKDVKARSLVFDTGMVNVYNTSSISLPVRDQLSVNITADQIEISSTPGEDFAVNNDDIVVVDSNNTNLEIASAVTSSNSTVLTITLAPGQSPTATATLYYNKRIQSAESYGKIVKSPYVKVDYNTTDAAKKYSLGFADVFQILSITDVDDKDVTNSFALKTNQKDNFYDVSYIEYVPGTVEPADGLLTIQLRVFKLDTASGIYFFTAESYPVSDSSFDSNDIPIFEDSSGKRFNLKNSIDFRPHVLNATNADYDATDPATAPTISYAINTEPTFTGGFVIPSLNENATVDIEYYLTRIDAITLDSFGKFGILKGDESENSIQPNVKEKLRIAEISIPGRDALTPQEAANKKRPESAIRVAPRGVKNYTMEDISSIERRLQSIEYYVSLNALEKNARDLNILDENGLTRFKNGIVVDPFDDLSYANLDDVNYSAAINSAESSLTPQVKGFPISLKYKSSANSTIYPTVSNAKTASVARDSDVQVLSQQYATNFRNCVSNFYNYAGIGSISPAFDFSQDFVTNPIEVSIGPNGTTVQRVRNVQGINPLVQPNVSTVTRTAGNTTTTTTTNTSNVGDFITDLRLSPFIRSRDINLFMSGLRPNTQHYFFFDQEDVNANVIPGSAVDTADEIQRNGNFNDPVISDDNGVIRAVFVIPEETFFAGDRVLRVADVSVFDNIESAGTSGGTVVYRAFNFEGERQSLTVNVTTVRSVVRRPVVVRRQFEGGGGGGGDRDPIAQTFYIKEGMGRGSDTIFVSKVDLFFRRKSQTNGVNIMIREVENGYPSSKVVQFGRIHLTPDQINVSDDASAVTEVRFDSPVRLDTEREYAIVVMPDANDPDYLIYTSKVGGQNIVPGDNQGLAVVQDWGDGVLFTSTNNRAWRSYQDEDIKFNLYRHNFNESFGTVTLTNDDNEFFTLENVQGKFRSDELVYVEKDVLSGTGTSVSIVSGSDIISGTGLDATYAAGDFIRVFATTPSLSKIFRIVEVISSSEIRVTPSSSITQSVEGKPVIAGNVSYFNYREGNELHLEKSSASSTRSFQAGDEINGIDSGATATITSIDNIELSYVQPMISRIVDTVSNVSASGKFTYPNLTDSSYDMNIPFNDNVYFNRNGAVVFSRSNDVSLQKPFEITLDMTNGSNVTSSPVVNIDTATLLAYQYKITNDSSTTSKYISKAIELAADLDAEDLKLFVTAYRPLNTDVKAYIKAQNAVDPTSFDELDWVELSITEGSLLFSSTTNRDDFREFIFSIPASNRNANRVYTYTNPSGETFEGYRKFAIKIELLADDIYNSPRLLDYRGIALT